MLEKQFSQFLEDMTYSSSFQFLEEGKNADELKDVAKEHNLVLPSNDLSIFKCVYAFVDRQNLNKCTLPREEVAKALPTLNGKAIDFDHFRKRVVGHWLKGKVEGDKIIAYGVFYKSNFSDDFDTVKELFQEGNLAISFEAWGERIPNPTGYDLTDIHFAGGALLLKESPAFPGSEVLEMAKNRVLEFAKVMTPPQTFVHGKEDELPELARMYLYDAQMIARLLGEIDCPVCREKGMIDLLNMDYETSSGKIKCVNCNTVMQMELTPKVDVTKKGKPRQLKAIRTIANLAMLEDIVSFINGYEESDESLEDLIVAELEEQEEGKKLSYKDRKNIKDDLFAVILSTKNKVSGEPRKIRMFPIHDPAHVRNALARLAQSKVQQTLQKLGVSIDSVRRKILTRARELNMKDLLERYKKGSVDELLQMYSQEIAGRELTEKELEQARSLLDVKGNSTANATSLTKVAGQSTSNETSIQTASISEDDVKVIVKEVSGVKAKEEAAAKEAAEKAAQEKAAAEAKAKEEAAKSVSDLASAQEKIKALEAELAGFRKEKEEAEKAKVAEKVKARRDELGDFAKEMKDEDILDETKYEMAKLKKENSELKQGKKTEQPKPNLTKGSSDKDSTEKSLREKVNKMAFPHLENSKE